MASPEAVAGPEFIAGTTSVMAGRIGLIGDDHCAKEDGSDLPDEVFTAFAGVDLIIHLGHMGVRETLARGVLDRLEKLAPVLAIRDFSTDNEGRPYITPAEGDRVAGLTRIIEVQGVRIGAVHNLDRPPGPVVETPPGGMPELNEVSVEEVIGEKFGRPVDVVAYASTHRPATIKAGGVLFVNPGSPTYPKGPGRVAGVRTLGTVGILSVSPWSTTFETIELSTLTVRDE